MKHPYVWGILIAAAVIGIDVAAMKELIKHDPKVPPGGEAWVDPDPRPGPEQGQLALGKWVFRRNCTICHGAEGVGGIQNPNASFSHFPALKDVARKLTLSSPEEVRTVQWMLEQKKPLDQIEPPPFERWPLVVGQSKSILELIHKGYRPNKKDPKGTDPQAMPNWGAILSQEEINATLSYVISLHEWRAAEPRPDASQGRIALGKWIFANNCWCCHGEKGVGGIGNPNYTKDTIPELHTLAETRLKLQDEEDAKAIIDLLDKGVDLEKLEKKPIGNFNVVLAQYKAIRDVIRNGSSEAKNTMKRRNPDGPEPQPMPEWGRIFSADEINAIIAYLLTLQKWDEEGSMDTTPKPKTEGGALGQGETLPEAELVNQDGKKFRISDLRGSVVVVSFIYTTCDTAAMCPMAMSKLAEVQKRNIPGVRYLLISFDPERDTPEKLKEYAARYQVDTSTFWLATGQVASLAKSLNNLYRQVTPGQFDHTMVVAIADQKGVLRDEFFGTGWSVDDFASTLERLVKP